ncbi:MAG: DEAD/DEAH box helicase [Kiritimatiellia bacterium]
MTTFNETGLSSELLKGIAELGFQEPTPIQAKVIPLLIKGRRDVVALAQTGTGKTAAFGLPLLQLTDPASPAIQALVLCPTRELCLQIAKDLSNFGRFAPQLRILAVYGGSSIQTQMRSLHRGVHILVATPGRLNDLLRRGVARLDGVQRVVLDEADEMLNMGFQEDLETILGEVPDEARTLLFSATMPRQVAAIASKYMDDPEEVIVTAKNSSALKIEHHCHVVHARDRYEVLKRILDCNPDFFGIVFCRTRAETQDLCSGLQSDGYAADALHGDLSQEQRDRVMRQFRVRGVRILVATDVAARGLDVQDITHVIHFDLPGDPDVYTHRSGRTGRAGKSGVSIVLAHMREEGKIRLIERIINKRFEHARPHRRAGVRGAAQEPARADQESPESTADLDPFREVIQENLKDLTREDLIDLFLLREFGPVLERYQGAPDLNAHQARPAHERAGARRFAATAPRPTAARGVEHRPDGAVFLHPRQRGQTQRPHPASLHLPHQPRHPGPMLPLGRIRVMDTNSIFDPGQRGRHAHRQPQPTAVQNRQIRAVPAGD